jgi:hypothetical protein
MANNQEATEAPFIRRAVALYLRGELKKLTNDNSDDSDGSDGSDGSDDSGEGANDGETADDSQGKEMANNSAADSDNDGSDNGKDDSEAVGKGSNDRGTADDSQGKEMANKTATTEIAEVCSEEKEEEGEEEANNEVPLHIGRSGDDNSAADYDDSGEYNEFLSAVDYDSWSKIQCEATEELKEDESSCSPQLGYGLRWNFCSILILFLILALSVCICVAPDSWDLSFDRIMNFTNADEANVKGKAANTTLTDQDQESVGYCRLSMVSMFEKWCDVADDDGKPPSDAITPKHDNRASSLVGKGTISEEEHYRMFTLLLQWFIVQDALVAKVHYDAHDQNGKLEGNTSDESYCSLPHRADKSPPRQWDKEMIIFLVVTGWLLAVRTFVEIHKLWKKNQILDKRCR